MRRIFRPGSISGEATFALLVKEERFFTAEDAKDAKFFKLGRELVKDGRYCELEREQKGTGQPYELHAPITGVQQGHYKNLCVPSASFASSVVNNVSSAFLRFKSVGRAER